MSKTIEEIIEEYTKGRISGTTDFNEMIDKSLLQPIEHVKNIAERYAQSQTQELQEQNAELVNVIKDLIPMAEDGYRLHKNNGSHQDFLEDDRDILKKAKELLTKNNHLNKKP